MSLQDEIDSRIATWLPEGLPGGSVPEWVLFVRTTVAAAGPRNVDEARNALRWAGGLVEEATAADMPLVAGALFGAASVSAYLEPLTAPKGTKVAMSSLLRRLHPDIGCAGTTRTKAATTDVHVPGVVLVERPRPVLSADVSAAIDRFVPTLLPVDVWAHISGVVRSIVRDAAPTLPSGAVNWCRDVAYLTAWLHSEHRVLVPSAILKARAIEEFLGVLLKHGRMPRSVASYAANLHAIRDARGIPLDVVRRPFPKATAKEPYNPAEIAMLYEQARRIPAKPRRQFATTCLDLMFGVGAKPAETTFVVPADVSRDASGVFVCLSGRPVPALPAYAARIWDAAVRARATGESFMVGGLATNRPNRLSQLLHGKGDRWRVHADSRRARATWLVEIAARPGPRGLPGLLEMAGLSTMQRFDELIEHIAARQLELSDTSFLTTTPAVGDGEHGVAS